MGAQTEQQAYAANAKEWARSLSRLEIAQCLTERRSCFKAFEIKALKAEEQRRIASLNRPD